MASRLTKFQQTHRPMRVIEIKCTSRKPLDTRGFCPDCGRHLKRGGQNHLPARQGSLGWVEHYRDGSTRTLAPEA